MFGDIQNYHFTRGVRTYGKYETIYEESSALGDIYLQSTEDDPPVVSHDGGTTTVKINDILTEEKELEVAPDLVVLVTGMVPRADSNALTRARPCSATPVPAVHTEIPRPI